MNFFQATGLLKKAWLYVRTLLGIVYMPFLPKWHTKVKHWSLFVSFSHCCNLCMYMIYCHTMIFLNRSSKNEISSRESLRVMIPPPWGNVLKSISIPYMIFHQIRQFNCMCGSTKIAPAGQFQLKYTEYTRILHNTGVKIHCFYPLMHRY